MECETAADLVRMIGYEKAARFFGISEISLRKWLEIHELAESWKSLLSSMAISYAREWIKLPRKLRTPEIENALVSKLRSGLISDPLQLRSLSRILRDPDAKAKFLEQESTIQDALRVLVGKRVRRSRS